MITFCKKEEAVYLQRKSKLVRRVLRKVHLIIFRDLCVCVSLRVFVYVSFVSSSQSSHRCTTYI